MSLTESKRMRRILLPLAAAGVLLGAAPPGAGARVRAVRAGSPAAQAGMKAGDVVIAAGGEDVRGDADLERALSESGRKSVAVRRDAAIRIFMVDIS
jgi:S1-C subfamily serine protease